VDEIQGLLEFLACEPFHHLFRPLLQVWVARVGGCLPITSSGHQALRVQGPGRRVGGLQNGNSRGLRRESIRTNPSVSLAGCVLGAKARLRRPKRPRPDTPAARALGTCCLSYSALPPPLDI
jgi:hypothetical protein